MARACDRADRDERRATSDGSGAAGPHRSIDPSRATGRHGWPGSARRRPALPSPRRSHRSRVVETPRKRNGRGCSALGRVLAQPQGRGRRPRAAARGRDQHRVGDGGRHRAIHDRRRRPFGPTADPIGYVVRGSRSVYFAGDTDLDPAMADLRGSIDVALVPIWGWGRSVGAGHLDPRRAALAVALIAPAVAIPIHWGTFTVRWFGGRRSDMERPAIEFAALVQRHARGVDVRLLAPGERVDV